MKKRNMKLPKRLLSMSLALSMCVGMACTTAFAEDDPDKYVYVYVNGDANNVIINDADETDKPTFTYDTDNIDKAEKAVEELAGIKGEEKPEFLAPEKEENQGQSNLDIAAGALEGALKELQDSDNMPNFTEPADDSDVAPDDGLGTDDNLADDDIIADDNIIADDGTDNSSDAANSDSAAISDSDQKESNFTNNMNGAIDELNGKIEGTEDKVETAQGEAKDKLITTDPETGEVTGGLIKEKLDLDQAAQNALEELNSARETADQAVAQAEQAAQNLTSKRDELQAQLNQQIAELGQKPSETAPVRDSYESQEAYEAAHAAWQTASEAYNIKVQAIQQAYTNNQSVLEGQITEAQNAVAEAKSALEQAKTALETFQTAQGNYAQLEGSSEALKAYNEALNAYNEAAKAYNDKAGDYNEAVDGYQEAATEYNQAVEDHNVAAGEYNNQAQKYNDAVEEYVKEVNDYNGHVDDYNSNATDWNSDKAEVDTLKDDLEAALENVGLEIDIQGAQNVLSKNPSCWSDLSDEEYNKQVATYNQVVDAYNSAVKTYNENLAANKIKEVEECFDGQVAWETDGGNHWYTLGKLEVDSSFLGAYKGDFLGQGDLYVWQPDENGDWKGSDAENNPNQPISQYEYEDGSFKQFMGELDKKDFTTANQVDSNAFDDSVSPSINKWVLTVAYGANTGTPNAPYVDGGSTTWHINGYLQATKLNELLKLEERVVKKYDESDKITEMADDNVATVDPGTDLKDADTYNVYGGVLEPVIDVPQDSNPTWSNEVDDLPTVSLDPINLTGIYITPPTEPETPELPPVVTEPDDTTPPVVTDPDDTTPPVVTDPDDTDTDTNVPEEEVPLVEAPVVDVPEEEVPLVEAPVVDIPEEEVPLAEAPAEVEIEDDEVPLAAVPQTGDISALWYVVTLLSACGLAVLTLRRKEHG